MNTVIFIVFLLGFAFFASRLSKKPKSSRFRTAGLLGGLFSALSIVMTIYLTGVLWLVATGGMVLGLLVMGAGALLAEPGN